ncbi:MAG: L,D-transpeptidase [Polyangiaceae bacterium]
MRALPFVKLRAVAALSAAAGLALGAAAFQAPAVHAEPACQEKACGDARAAGPWTDSNIVLPDWATAVRVVRGDEYILEDPRSASSRRGSAAREARLPLFGARYGAGCSAPWYSVGPSAWICGDYVELARGTPIPASGRTFAASNDGLPFRYYFVGPDGTSGYKQLREVEIVEPTVNLEPGFAVAITEEASVEGQRYGLSGNDVWIPMRDLSPARPFSFQGAEIPAGAEKTIPVGWVVASSARVFTGASTASSAGVSLAQFVKVDILEEKGSFEKFYRIDDNRWVLAKDIRRPTIAPPPKEIDVDAHERWIDVELATQTLVAYEGSAPVFATLVSTGRGAPGTANATPKGTFHIWVKLASANMDNLENENANRFYRMENVPFVQYFDKGVGLHGAYWHRSFGKVRSHGCVNLAPLDAQRLFYFTSPRLPAGWTAILPTDLERGSLVRVR